MSEKLKTVDIKGKPYVEVAERIRHFRDTYKDYQLVSELVSSDADSCLFKASILNPQGVVVATGHAREEKASSYINKTSYIENCETSAWGRALGNFGIGVDATMAIASANEVVNAMTNQDKPAAKPTPTANKPASTKLPPKHATVLADKLPTPSEQEADVLFKIYTALAECDKMAGKVLSKERLNKYLWSSHKRYPSDASKVAKIVDFIQNSDGLLEKLTVK